MGCGFNQLITGFHSSWKRSSRLTALQSVHRPRCRLVQPCIDLVENSTHLLLLGF